MLNFHFERNALWPKTTVACEKFRILVVKQGLAKMQLLGNSANFHTRGKERSDLASAIPPNENRPAERSLTEAFGSHRENGAPCTGVSLSWYF